MFRDHVLPRLTRILGPAAVPAAFHTFRIFGIGESNLATALEPRLHAIPGLELGYCCRLGEVDLRLIGTAEAVQAGIDIVRSEYAEYIVTESEDAIEKVVVDRLAALSQTVATAESCTGGAIAAAITDVSGSSQVFHRGYVTYANQAKTEILGVPEHLLRRHGAVSRPVARAMADGCLRVSGAHHALAVTGIAGPTGGSQRKPVGTVHIALASRDTETWTLREFFPLDRASFKARTARAALDLLRRRLQSLPPPR